MKNFLTLSIVLFLGWCFCGGLCAQACQPSPACKAVCAELKADAANVAANNQQVADQKPYTATIARTGSPELLPALLSNLFSFSAKGQASAVDKSNCDPKNCDPSNCDPTKCDWSKCDPRKCLPANCKGAGERAQTTRL